MYATPILDCETDVSISAKPASHAAAAVDKVHVEEITSEAHPLAERFYRANGYKIRCGRQERLFVVRVSGEIIAAARLLPRQQGTWWLRNMLVAKQKRHAGIGACLMREIQVRIRPGACYCFALPEVVDFYQRLGFMSAMPEQCPTDIAAEYGKYKSRGRDWVLMFVDSSAYTTR